MMGVATMDGEVLLLFLIIPPSNLPRTLEVFPTPTFGANKWDLHVEMDGGASLSSCAYLRSREFRTRRRKVAKVRDSIGTQVVKKAQYTHIHVKDYCIIDGWIV